MREHPETLNPSIATAMTTTDDRGEKMDEEPEPPRDSGVRTPLQPEAREEEEPVEPTGVGEEPQSHHNRLL